MINTTISIGNVEIAETSIDLTRIGIKKLGMELSNFANHAATLAAFQFASLYAFRTDNGSTITNTVYVHFGDKPPIHFPAQIDFSTPGNMVDVLDKFRFELAQNIKEVFAFVIIYKGEYLDD